MQPEPKHVGTPHTCTTKHVALYLAVFFRLSVCLSAVKNFLRMGARYTRGLVCVCQNEMVGGKRTPGLYAVITNTRASFNKSRTTRAVQRAFGRREISCGPAMDYQHAWITNMKLSLAALVETWHDDASSPQLIACAPPGFK